VSDPSRMEVALRSKRQAGGTTAYPHIDFNKAVAWCEGRTGKTLAPSQREALKTVLGNRVIVITGGPGVGKTTLVNSILLILRAKGVKCLLCAPTGRAAKRLPRNVLLRRTTPYLGSCARHRNFVGRAVAHVSFSGRCESLRLVEDCQRHSDGGGHPCDALHGNDCGSVYALYSSTGHHPCRKHLGREQEPKA
jgi:AAA domain-containing protein